MKEKILCLMCEKPSEQLLNLQGDGLENAILCWECANKLQNIIYHCNLEWSFNVGIDSEVNN